MNSSDAQSWCRRLGIETTTAQRAAFVVLERGRQRFFVDFGYQNAIEKAREVWKKRKSKKN